jgi:hypothetical protein
MIWILLGAGLLILAAALLIVWTSKPDLGVVSSNWIIEHSGDRDERS